ncbi:two-component regulator propeller domain-containing protein [Spirosoma telluris]|uniref:ligand-binding sensor domain-containing protein n=1 Tax=Spirosoma telluris TaxID=2183553 RepID=UPI002FC32451
MRFLFFCQFILLVFRYEGLIAQSKGWQELTISDGLSQGMIFDLKQDQKGFIWIATKDGLNRYDGHNFKVFTHDSYNPYTLSENVCTALLIDQHQRIWIGTQSKGLNLLNPRTGRISHIKINAGAIDNSSSFAITQLVEDPEGNIWIGTENDRLVKLSLPPSLRSEFPDQPDFTSQVKLTPVVVREGDEKTAPAVMTFAAQHKLLASTWKGFYSLNWQKPHNARKLQLFDPNRVHHTMGAYADSLQNYWFTIVRNKLFSWHQGQIHTAYLKTDGSIRVHLKALDGQRIAVLTTDNLWIMSPEELFRQDSLTNQNAYVALPPNTFGVSSLFEDQTGNIWIGTMGYGLRKFNPRIRLFHSYLPNKSLSHIAINQQGRTFLRLYEGFAEFDRQRQLVPLMPPNTALPNRPEWFVLPDHQGFFWSFNTSRGVTAEIGPHELLKFSPDWKLLRRYTLPADCRLGVIGNQALEDSSGAIWIGATNGKLLRFDPQTEQFQVVDYGSVFPKIGAKIEVYSLLLESGGTLWIGTQQGLVRIRSLFQKPAFTLFRNLTNDRQSLTEDFVLSLCLDPRQPNQYLWIGTKGGGLDRFNKQTGQFTHFTEAQGLPNKVVYGVLADDSGNLWVSTNQGIAQFNPKTSKFRTYTKNDGLQDNEFNNQSYAKAPTGELLFGGINGLTIFHPSEIVAGNQKPPKVAIVGLKINNKAIDVGGPEEILSEGIDYTTSLDLRHDQNLLTLEFGVMDHTNPSGNRYRYRLDGIDQDWVEAGTNRFANYAQLPSGSYRLAMMGSVDGEHWSKPIELFIRVRPPFYQTWWAYLCYLVVLGLLIWQFIRLQAQRLLLQQQVVFKQQEASRLQELDTLKTQFFTNISHEFRTPLTLILGPLSHRREKVLQEPELSMMERNGRRLMNLINQVLDLSKLDGGS